MFHLTGMPGWLRSGWRTSPWERPASPAPEDHGAELQSLREHAASLQAELQAVQRRLADLQGDPEEA